MAPDIRYDVSKLFQVAFGFNSPVFITAPLLNRLPPNISFDGFEILKEEHQDAPTSWMGTPILFEAKFKGGLYKAYQQNGELEEIRMGDFALPPATMFSFRRAKNITRTNILGSNGSVKEIYGFDDWIIDVRGLCLDEPSISAQEQFSELLQWEKLADAIQVEGLQFSRRELQRVCIAEWNDNIPQGKPGVVAFSMQLYGDEPIEFQIKQ